MDNPDNEIPQLILAQLQTRNKITLKQLMAVIDYEKVDINRALNALYRCSQIDRDMIHGSYVYRLSGGSEPALSPKAPKPKPAPKAEPEPEPFLDRQIHAKSITLSADKIKALAEMAVAS